MVCIAIRARLWNLPTFKQEMKGDQKSPSSSVFSQFDHQKSLQIFVNLYKSVNFNFVGDFSLLLVPRHSTDRREV